MSTTPLNPIDRLSEVLFGLYMAMGITGSLSVAAAGAPDARNLLAAALGCNLAWGFVDAVMYVLRNMVARGHRASFIRRLRACRDDRLAEAWVDQELPDLMVGVDAAGRAQLRRYLQGLRDEDLPRATMNGADLRGGLAVFALVVLATFPPVLPYVLLVDQPVLADHLSLLLSCALLLSCGAAWGRYAGVRPWKAGLLMALVGFAVKAVVLALGG